MIRRLAAWVVFAAFLGWCVSVVSPDPARLVAGLPRLARWLSTAFPPDFSDPADLARRASETVAIATLGTVVAAVAAAPLAVLLADEPVASLDPPRAESVLALLRKLARDDGLAVLVSLHQPDLARRFTDRQLHLVAGRLA